MFISVLCSEMQNKNWYKKTLIKINIMMIMLTTMKTNVMIDVNNGVCDVSDWLLIDDYDDRL